MGDLTCRVPSSSFEAFVVTYLSFENRHCSGAYGADAAGELHGEADFVSFVSREPAGRRIDCEWLYPPALVVRSTVSTGAGATGRLPTRVRREWNSVCEPESHHLGRR